MPYASIEAEPLDLPGIFGGGSAAGSSGGSSLGNTLGNLGQATGIPGAGLAGQVVGAVIGLFGGGGVPMGTTEFDGLHSPTLQPMLASSMHQPQAAMYAAYAQMLGISVEEVRLLILTDQATNSTNPTLEYVEEAWRTGKSGNPDGDNARIYLRRYNTRNPNAIIREGVKGPLGLPPVATPAPASGAGVPGLGFTGSAGVAVPVFNYGPTAAVPAGAAAAAAAANMTLADYLKALAAGALSGAQTGAAGALAGTPAGQQIKKDQINGFIKDYQLPIAFGLLGIGFLAVKAFKTR